MNEQVNGERHHGDSLTAELESMRQIAKVLDSLADEDARQRVLQWAHDRYRGTLTPQPTTTVRVAVDPVLEVEELGDLFDAPAPSASAPARTAAKPSAGVESMIKDFAADFRRFALEWQGA